ncbi:hypothetical protein DERF_002725 [Dermatophagoides farinae]|uniref:Phorbol-ester/DAG-type domain-containing protein n=1 Tax=Dermatophagoides farinae TaxID=6954 RepID=A0A922IG29_DERFA|nr:hypothetical protein DERF_002725 [Dermatophagoides farinae]
MVLTIKSSCRLSKEFNKELDDLIEYANKFERQQNEMNEENKRLKTHVETSENHIEQNETQRKTIENDLRKSKHECNDQNEEIRKQKLKITELEKAIDKQKRQVDEKESKISELRKKNEKLEKEVTEMATLIKSTPSTTSTAEIILPCGKIMNENFTSGYGGLYSSSGNDNDDVQTLKSKLIISERDMRAVNHKLENKTEICNILRTELSEIKQKLTDYEKSLDDEKKRSNGYSEKVSTYRSKLDQNKQEIERKDNEIVNLKGLVDENNNDFNLKLKVNAKANNFFDDQQNSNSVITATTSGSSTQPSNMELSKNERKLRSKTGEQTRRIDTLMKEIETCKRKNADLNYLVERITNGLNHSNDVNEQLKNKIEKYRNLLKCCEEQLDQYNIKFPTLLHQQKSQSSDAIYVLNTQLIELKNKNETLRNELKKLQAKLIEQQKHTEMIMENEKTDNNRLQRQLMVEQSKTERLEDEINGQQEIFENIEQELVAIKEEAAGHITKISQITNERLELEAKCESMANYIELLNERLQLFNNNLEQKSEEIYRHEETISQQLKLIDFIQSNCKCLEKKKPFMLLSFGSKLINGNQSSTKSMSEELERKLKNEREKNNFLNEQLNEMINELDERNSYVEKLRQEIRKLESQLKTKSYFEQTGGEHNFASKTIKLSNICVACAKSITIGSKAKICKNCGATIHSGCRLAYNCGLSLEMVRISKICKNCGATIHSGCRLSYNYGLSLEMVRIKSFGLGITRNQRPGHHNHPYDSSSNDYDDNNTSSMLDDDDNGSIITFMPDTTTTTNTTTTTTDESDINSI